MIKGPNKITMQCMIVKIIRFAYILVLALYVGGIAMFTFVTTPDIFGSFDRDTASGIVDKLFDGYFNYTVTLVAVALALVLLLWIVDRKTPVMRLTILILVTILLNCFLAYSLYPEMKEVKSRVVSFETPDEGSKARASFSDLHGLSMVLNLNLLLNGSILIYYGSMAGGLSGRQGGNNKDKYARKSYNMGPR